VARVKCQIIDIYYHAIPMSVNRIGLPLAIRLLFFSLMQWFNEPIHFAMDFEHWRTAGKVDFIGLYTRPSKLAKHNEQLYLRMSHRNWRQFVALDVSKLASGSGGSGIGHNVTLRSPQHRLNFSLLQLLLRQTFVQKETCLTSFTFHRKRSTAVYHQIPMFQLTYRPRCQCQLELLQISA